MSANESELTSVCVYCASSSKCDESYRDAAEALGRQLATAGLTIVYGGGGTGSMGALADGALAAGGRVIGVLPNFLKELELGRDDLSRVIVVDDMRTRKHVMLEQSDAVVALPGGTGTFEELFEAITLKRLGIFLGPIVILNTNAYYAPLIELLERAVEQRFMHASHLRMWTVVERPADVLPAIEAAPSWDASALKFATQ